MFLKTTLLLASALVAFGQASPLNQPALNQPAFSVQPAALYQAAMAEPVPPGAEVFILADEHRFVFDAQGRSTHTWRFVYRIIAATAADDWSEIEASWEPWHQDKPAIRARVITPDRVAHALDLKTVSESGNETSEPGIFTDGKVLRGPLPATGAGVLVEQEVVIRETAPLFDQGSVRRVYFGASVPVRQARLILDAPQSLPLTYAMRLLPSLQPQKAETGGRVRLTFERTGLEPFPQVERNLPADVFRLPHISFATGKSWQAVAARYAQIVDNQLRGSDVKSMVPRAALTGKSRPEAAAVLTAKLHDEIRYTGVEFGEASLVPRAPAETLRRKYGDCKDKAALLVAMFREAGIPASLALLTTGPDEDNEIDLPGMGAFDHAIVYVPGGGDSGKDLWIDATDPYSRIGQLPAMDQGRLALIVSPATTALVRIPESTSADNGSIETREFYLAESGPARVVEITESWGTVEGNYRQYYGTRDEEENKKQFESYVKEVYLADKLGNIELSEALDFSKPFRMRVEMPLATRGNTSAVDAAVAILPTALVQRIPSALLDAEAKRKSDAALLNPYTMELRYRIVPPPGFKARPLPESGEQRLGPALLTKEFKVDADGVVLATLRFDTVKRRYTPDETAELRKTVLELEKAPAILVTFEQIGQAYLSSGKVREALEEFRKLSALHPGESLHHSQEAQALLAAGVGEAAREEANRAIALEPTSKSAYQILGSILEHDLVGRRFKKGFDPAGAEAAYRKALELDPADNNIRADLAILLEHNAKGVRYARGAKLDDAISEYRKIHESIGENNFSNNLLIAMMWNSRFREMKQAAQALTTTPERKALIVVATASLDGPAVAIREASRDIVAEDARNQALRQAGETLILIRKYAESADLLAASAQGARDAAAVLGRVALLRGTPRLEEVALPDSDPRSVVKKFLAAAFRTDDLSKEVFYPLLSRIAAEAVKRQSAESFERPIRAAKGGLARAGLPPEVIADIFLGTMQMSVEGDDSTGYRIATQSPGTNTASNLTLYVVREDGQYKILDAGSDADTLGAEILARAESGDLVGARRLLDWVRESQPLGGGDDPYAGTSFPRFWTKGSQADRDAIRYAAAALMANTANYPGSVDILREGAAKAQNASRSNFDLALARALLEHKQYAEALPIAQRLLAASPESFTAFILVSSALGGVNDWANTEKIIAERLARLPDDPAAIRLRGSVLVERNKLEEAIALRRGLADAGKATAGDYNEWAWIALVRGSLTPEDIQAGERSNLLSQNNEPDALHTLAAIYAETGKTSEARDVLLHMLEISGLDEPNSASWYVFGRIAEQFGVLDAATADYRKVTKPEGKESQVSTYALAQRRLQAMGEK